MDADLVKAHDSLDAAVDKAFGARRRCTSEQQRQQILFERFAEMTSN
nr:type IIL restriction-modification enzyme MmeI [Brachybacterium avium]